MLETVILIENLKSGLTFANHAVSQRSQLPILLNFLLEATKEGLFVSATDLEIGIKVKIPAKIKKEGEIALSAKTFLDLITNLNQEKIEIIEKEDKIYITAEKLKTTLAKTPADDFPKLYQDKGERVADFKKNEFEKEASRIVFASSLDIGRPALSGVYIEKEKGEEGINLVATDGFRLSLKNNFAKGVISKKDEVKLLIPSRIIKEVLGVKEEDQKITLFTSIKSNQIIFARGDTQIIGRLIEADYPKYRKIIPEDFETRAFFDREEAVSAVRTCMVFAREASNIIKMGVEGGKIIFRASSPQVGENEVEIDARTEGEGNEIAFNARYLLDFLSSIDEEDLSFEMLGPLNPGVFRVPKDKNFLHIIMPIRVKE